MLVDSFQRRVGYLRLSLTEGCQMRCVYCRPEKHVGKPGAMTVAEITDLVGYLAANHGLAKVRLTGGDPSMRPDLAEVVAAVAQTPGVNEVAMTTNALTLARDAAALKAAGLSRVNISLDSLDAERFAALTGLRQLGRVLDGIDAAIAAGLRPKLNCVVVNRFNDEELADLACFAARKRVPIRYIELMPMGPLADRWADRYVPEAQMKANLRPRLTGWEPLEQGANAARCYQCRTEDGLPVEVGFITPMSCDFCAACNRLRVGSHGDFFPCLMDAPAGNLLAALRPVFDAEKLDALLAAGYARKKDVHPHNGFVTMTSIGG